MLKRPYGHAGLQVPVLGLDAMQAGDPANVDRNVATVAPGPLKLADTSAVAGVYEAPGRYWEGLVG